MKRLVVFFATLCFAAAAQAQIVTSLPFTLTNGTVADATQVMANFNQIVNNTNSNAAHNGANSDITSILGLTTALDYSIGGSSTFIGTGGGSANAQTVGSLTPGTGFSYVKGKTVTWVATVANTAAMTLNVNGLGAKNVFQLNTTGQSITIGGEVQASALITATYDGTEFVLQNSNNVVRLDNLGSLQGGIAVPTPQGRLTPTCGTPVLVADASAVTSVCYDPYNGNLIPIYNGTSYMQVLPFSELTLNIANAGFTANNVFDVFVFSNAGGVTIAAGPAWTTAGNFVRTTTLTAGVAARSTALTRVNGLLVNTGGSMSARNGASTFTIPTQQGTYVGSIWIDAAGQATTCQVTAGQNRTCGVWNMYNRVPMMLSAFDSTASWTWNSSTFHAANATAANSITVLQGFAEEILDTNYIDYVNGSNNGILFKIGIGLGSTSTQSGVVGIVQPNNAGTLYNGTVAAHAATVPFIGTQAVVALEAVSSGTGTFNGASANMELRANWRG